MRKNDLVYAGHMLDMAKLAVSKIQNKSRSDFDADENLRLALTHLIQIIGEAACHTSEKLREQHPAISWDRAIGMRHRVVHDYLHVDYDIVWNVVNKNLPKLIQELEKFVPPVERE